MVPYPRPIRHHNLIITFHIHRSQRSSPFIFSIAATYRNAFPLRSAPPGSDYIHQKRIMNYLSKLAPFLSLALFCISSFFALAQEDGPYRIAAVFVNNHPRDEITLYWVDPLVLEGDPERLVSIVYRMKSYSDHDMTSNGSFLFEKSVKRPYSLLEEEYTTPKPLKGMNSFMNIMVKRTTLS